MNKVRCHLKEIVLDRGNEFELYIPELHIPQDSANKIPLMGKSGAGKSTLLNLMAAIEWPHKKSRISWRFPDNTEISWGKKGLRNNQASELRCKYFGYAFQDSTLISHLTVCDNLCYPLELKKECCSNEEARIIARKALDKVLIESFKLNEQSLRKLRSKNVSEDIITKLKSLENKDYSNKKNFLKAY